MISLKRRAKRRVETEADHLERFYERRYGRPAFGGKFEDKSIAYWQLEMLTDIWRQRREIEESIRVQQQMAGRSAEVSQRMQSSYRHLRAIDALFGDEQAAPSVVQRWDAELQAGRAPDLKGHMRTLKVPASLKSQLDQLQRGRPVNRRG